MSVSVADPSTTARWSAAMSSDKIVPQWSLRQSCLSTVKDSVLGYSRGRRNSVTAQSPQHNPFLEYPIDLRHELLDHLLRLQPTGRELLKAAELLVAAGLPAFDLRCLDDCKFSDVRPIAEALVRTGNCLRELALAGQWLYHEEGAELAGRILTSCPNLRHLKLQHTSGEGGELRTVLRGCSGLQRLEILHPSTEEAEIEELAEDVRKDPEAYEGVRRSLTEVRLPSSVSGRGVMTLLRALPNVKYVACTFLDPIVDELEDLQDENEREYWKERMSEIKGLHVCLPVCADTPALVAQWFPGLEEISLEVQEETELAPLSELPRLRSLELKNSPTLPLSYMEEVLPLLSACGRRLLSLSLERFDLIDLASTAALCPGLRSFSAQWFTILSAGPAVRKTPQFLDLRYLRLRPRVGRRVTPEACEILLTHSLCLKHLEFYCSYGLTDALVSRLLKTNPFSRLRTLLLRHGHGLSGNGILQMTRAAQSLRVWDVGMIYSKQSTTPDNNVP